MHFVVTVQLSFSAEENDKSDAGDKYYTVKDLIERFNEVGAHISLRFFIFYLLPPLLSWQVSSWITHIIISQPTHEMRYVLFWCK